MPKQFCRLSRQLVSLLPGLLRREEIFGVEKQLVTHVLAQSGGQLQQACKTGVLSPLKEVVDDVWIVANDQFINEFEHDPGLTSCKRLRALNKMGTQKTLIIS